MHDTRDHVSKHKNVDDWLESRGHKIIRSKMYVGDLTLLVDQHICIDLKRNIGELAQNLTTDKNRFRAELQRAYDAQIILVILTENNDGIMDISQLPTWVNPRAVESPLAPSGERLYKISRALSGAYHTIFAFCDPSATGRIVEATLLNGRRNKLY